MPSKRKAWWNRQTTAIKIAIIGGTVSLIGALCTCIGGLLIPLFSFYLSNTPIKSTTYTLNINSAFEFRENPVLFTEINGREFGVVPTECALVDYGGLSDFTFDVASITKDVTKKSFAFDIVTERSLVITNGIIRMKSFQSPPVQETITEISFFDPPGMAEVPILFFPERTINSSTQDLTISLDQGSLRLDPGDAVTLVFPLIFSEPGTYKFVFIIEGQQDLSRKAEFVSEEHTYAWLYVDNIQKYRIKSFSGMADMKWKGDCP